MSETIYLNSLRGKRSNYGIKLSGKASDIIAEIQKHTNSKGFINIELKERKQPDNYGNTHYAVVDTWEPTKPANEAKNEVKDDLPF